MHAKTGRTAGLTPFESVFGKDAIKPLLLRLPLDKAGAWNDERLLDTAGQAMPLHHVRGSAQILDAAVGTASNKDVLNSHILHPLSLGESHIIQRFLRSGALGCVRKALRFGNCPGNRPHLYRKSVVWGRDGAV